MRKLITALFIGALGGVAFGQWTPIAQKRGVVSDPLQQQYKLDIGTLKQQLKNAQETGSNAKPVEIMLPTLRGKMERFAVYSFPVVVKELADQYDLGSYVGVGIDDPTKFLRFSLAPNDFQSMIIGGGEYQFIDAYGADKTVYTVHPKTKNTGSKPFVCSTEEGASALQQIQEMTKGGNSFNNQFSDMSKNSDKKYRTMKLVMSVTGEYTAFHGGTVTGALTAINATLTRVNGVFEKDFALHLNLQNYNNVIYTDATADPYSDAATGSQGAWNLELQNALTTNVGSANYDIGHLFGASGGGGNAGCIGCVCIAPTTAVPKGKGSGYTSPADGIPQGDNFDIDYVAHEIGHQLGANHTFSHGIEGTNVNMEPGSGSTIMGYAGITGANTDVQAHSDAYFHKASIGQVQANLITKTCDVETTVANDPPVISSLPSYTIPKGTAFVLTASVTDPQNDPMTYTWEQVDSGTTTAQTINKTNLGTTTYGAAFRSFTPTTSPTRYFPKFSSVLAGVLDNSLNTWESAPMVARTMNFAITARDNNANVSQQQTQTATQTITVGADGPFTVTTGTYLYTNLSNIITWNVANTSTGAYNTPNVKLDYSTDNGVTWTVLLASTANDGTETVPALPTTLNGQTAVLRVSAVGNVFYAIKKMTVAAQATCGTAVTGITVTTITASSATVSWPAVSGATSYVIQYRPVGSTTWSQTTSTTSTVGLSGLNFATNYEVQVAAVCGTQGPFSASTLFTTATLSYCTITATNSSQFEYISNVTLSYNSTALMTNTTGPSNYSNYSANTVLTPNLAVGNTYGLSITVEDGDWDTVVVFIDYNNNGTFESTERVLNYPVALIVAPVTGTFTVPATAVTNTPLRMRVILYYAGSTNAGLSLGSTFAGCGTIGYGEVEDYSVLIPVLSTNETSAVKNLVQVYPNPATEVLNITKVSDNAKFEIHNAVGQLVKSGLISNNQVRVAELVKGTYLITIKDKEITETVKFIKK